MWLKSITRGLKDIIDGLGNYPIVFMLGWNDVLQRYRRSTLGPFWLTISMGVMVASLGFVFGQVFKTPLKDYLPFLASGLIFWGFISSTINEGCEGFVRSEALIKQIPIPLSVHILRVVWRNLLILMHNVIIIPITLLAFGRGLGLEALATIPGLLLLAINIFWMALFLGVLCARYRDMPQIVLSLLQVLFYMTPIIWMPSLLPERAGIYLLELNPVYHLLSIVREPLLGNYPSPMNWIVSIIIALIGWLVTCIFYGRYKRRIAYWL